MDKTYLEEQKKLAAQRLEDLGGKDVPEKKVIAVISEYLSSLLYPENFTDAQREDLRKLALEFGYEEDSDFSKWTSILHPAEN